MDELCVICGRVSFGKLIYTGFGHWRHEDCCLGSEAWKLYYQSQSLKDRKVLSEFYNYHKGVNYD